MLHNLLIPLNSFACLNGMLAHKNQFILLLLCNCRLQTSSIPPAHKGIVSSHIHPLRGLSRACTLLDQLMYWWPLFWTLDVLSSERSSNHNLVESTMEKRRTSPAPAYHNTKQNNSNNYPNISSSAPAVSLWPYSPLWFFLQLYLSLHRDYVLGLSSAQQKGLKIKFSPP